MFALFSGVLGFVLDRIEALDVITRANDIAPQVLVRGVKYSLLEPTFGLVIFLIGRLATFLLLWNRKE